MAITAICVALFLTINIIMLYFAVKYRRSRHPQSADIDGSVLLELAWTVIPAALVVFMFYLGLKGYAIRKDAPGDALAVNVRGQMWSWIFQYANGKESSALALPLNRAVKFNLTSGDVIHSFFIPAFGIKGDVVPGRQNTLWAVPIEKGSFDVFCTEYCGAGHSIMLSKAVVMDEKDFEEWYGAR
ncbi:MAG: cytochrome c oxidase subunit II [Deltaproteobacteria bacterium]|nr:cytochrome c oxidase subunit II [Deltaproteobacteria bacterium]